MADQETNATATGALCALRRPFKNGHNVAINAHRRSLTRQPLAVAPATPSAHASVENCVPVQVLADEITFGDLMRDCGVFRRVVRVEPQVASWSVLVFFDSSDGVSYASVSVPFGEAVTVWRASSGPGVAR